MDAVVATLIHEGYSVVHHLWDPSKDLNQNIACWEVAEHGVEIDFYTALLAYVPPYNSANHSARHCLRKLLEDREQRLLDWRRKCNNG